jgi:Uma2 family endonuclease
MSEARGTIERMDEARDPLFPARPPTAAELPYDDGEPMESARHYEQMHLLTNTLYAWLRDREDWHVAGNRAVYFSLQQAKNQDFRAPDVFVVLDVPDGRRERLSWVAWEEGGRLPNVVVEIVSQSTEREDRGRKKDIYESVWRLPEYFLFEPFGAVLEGWELDPETRRYVKKVPDARGDLRVLQMNMALGVRPLACYSVPAPSLRWILPDGTPLPTHEEMAEASRAEAEAQRAEAEAQRADADAQRAEAEAQRAEADAQRARADAAEAELARLRGSR